MSNTIVDPFLDDQFAPLDTRTGPQHPADTSEPPAGPPQPSLETPQQAVDDQPQVETFDIEGGTVTIEYDKKKGWTGILSLEDGGGDEVFYGKTQKELMTKVLAGKAKATAQIRKLNRKIKLGTPVAEEPVVAQEPVVTSKQLDANDVFEIKTAAEADLDKAMSLRFKKKYGMSEDEFVNLVHQIKGKATKGEEAYEELTIEGVSKEFLEAHKDDYYPYSENGDAIMTWLCRNKLRRNVRTTDNFGTISAELLRKGLYTVENLEEALDDLKDSGLLTPPPQEEIEEEPVATPAKVVTPAQPANTNSRIVSQKRQPRGGLGIRANTASTTVQQEEPRAPSADELENMSDKEISELLARTRQYARSTRR